MDFRLLLDGLRRPEFFEDFFSDLDEWPSTDQYSLHPQTDFHTQISNPFSLFLFEVSDQLTRQLGLNGFLFVNHRELTKLWKQLSQAEIMTARADSKKHAGWKAFVPQNLPLNSILIVDPYLGNNTKILKQNIAPLIEVLASESSPHLEIMLLYGGNPKYAKQKQLPPAQIRQVLTQTFSVDATEQWTITVIQAEPAVLHDRFILTNYFQLTSGRSFSFFKKVGRQGKDYFQISHDTTLTLFPVGRQEHFAAIQEELARLREIVNNVPAIDKMGDQLVAGTKSMRFFQ
jgi:hypothetical protein